MVVVVAVVGGQRDAPVEDMVLAVRGQEGSLLKISGGDSTNERRLVTLGNMEGS